MPNCPFSHVLGAAADIKAAKEAHELKEKAAAEKAAKNAAAKVKTENHCRGRFADRRTLPSLRSPVMQ